MAAPQPQQPDQPSAAPQLQATLCRGPPTATCGRAKKRPATGGLAVQWPAAPRLGRCAQYRPPTAIAAAGINPCKADDAPKRLGHTGHPFLTPFEESPCSRSTSTSTAASNPLPSA